MTNTSVDRSWSNPTIWQGTDGECWSSEWGSVEREWTVTITPRIAGWTGMVVDLGCGKGRWTDYLRQQFSGYIGCDPEPTCIARCRERNPSGQWRLTDGATLPIDHADFVFSWGALCSVTPDVLRSYVRECGRILSPSGGAFIHHCGLTARQTADVVQQAASECGLFVREQELHDWPRGDLSGCFTTLTRQDCERRLWVNQGFHLERAQSREAIPDR